MRVARRLACPVLVASVLLGIALSAQAQNDQADEIDPWESYNRWMFKFNDGADRLIIKPVAQGYDFVIPEIARVRVNNFFTNFMTSMAHSTRCFRVRSSRRSVTLFEY